MNMDTPGPQTISNSQRGMSPQQSLTVDTEAPGDTAFVAPIVRLTASVGPIDVLRDAKIFLATTREYFDNNRNDVPSKRLLTALSDIEDIVPDHFGVDFSSINSPLPGYVVDFVSPERPTRVSGLVSGGSSSIQGFEHSTELQHPVSPTKVEAAKKRKVPGRKLPDSRTQMNNNIKAEQKKAKKIQKVVSQAKAKNDDEIASIKSDFLAATKFDHLLNGVYETIMAVIEEYKAVNKDKPWLYATLEPHVEVCGIWEGKFQEAMNLESER